MGQEKNTIFEKEFFFEFCFDFKDKTHFYIRRSLLGFFVLLLLLIFL